MLQTSRKTFITTVTLLSLLAATSLAADAPDLVNMPASEMAWEKTVEGVSFAPLQGDRFKEAYSAMVRLPAGLVSPPQIKSANMYGMVISGTLVNVAAGGLASAEIELPTGSYYKIPAGFPHVSKCISKTDCVTFIYQDGKFDFLPAVR